MRSLLPSGVVLGILAAAVSAATTVVPASAGRAHQAAQGTSVTVHRGGPDATVRFSRARSGEAFLDVAVSARGVSWADRGNASAVVSAYVDGRYATDIVITSSTPVTRQFALGSLNAGRHTLRLHYSVGRSPSNAGIARLQDIGFETLSRTSPAYVAARYAPVLYGRNVAALGDRFQNNHTDTPLVAWHQVLPDPEHPRRQIIEYSVVWSNEDGGTITPSLMAKWGRTTDIEWVYRVEVNAHGHRVPGTGVFQSAGHGTTTFHGRYAGTHPLLETCTSNNNVCDKVDDPMRFALSTRDVLPAEQPREHIMDIHPWTYQVMAREMVRERKLEKTPDPSTTLVGDQRSYLYVAVDHVSDTPADAASVGLAVDVTLHGGAVYSSDHQVATQFSQLLTIDRAGPAATTVELPVGTKPADIESISVRRVPFAVPSGAPLMVTDLDRAFFLGPRYLPRPPFADVHGSDIVLTAENPTADLWPTP